jgi:two-component system sensor histidine kinase KdpD
MGWEDIPRMIVFVLMAVMISSLTEARRRSAKKLSDLAEELKQSNELKSALLASVSHDLRTPLTSIRAATDSLLNQKFDWDEATKREFHQIISEEVSRLLRLVENLLAMARIEAGELGLSKQWGSIAEICSNALDQCAPELQRHRIRAECPDDSPLIKADHRIIAEALTHLVENAAKYSPVESEIVVRASFNDGEISFSVEDKGPGIAPEESERIFEKFYRGACPDSRRTDGAGMWLAITRGLIEAHGGRIWVKSEPGQGATFTMALQVEHKQGSRTEMADDEL